MKALFTVVLLILIGACEAPLPPLKLQQGTKIDELNVFDLHAKKTKLPLATGKVIVLNVWATWCGPCRHEMPSLDRLSNLLDKKKFLIVGLSVDSDDHVVREFLIERAVGFSNYMDPSMEVANQVFGVRAFPSTFIFSPEGKLLDVIEGWRSWDTPDMVTRMNNYLRK